MIGKKNTAKSGMLNGGKITGAWLHTASPMTAEIMANAGFDMLMIDMEHGPGDIPQTVAQIQAMQGYKAVPFVRSSWNDFVQIKRILDAGAYGVLVPYVNTADEVRQAVAATKYPPHGVRGLATSPRSAGFGVNFRAYVETANDEVCLWIGIESEEAVANLDEMLQVEGLDGIFIGPMDLATSHGSLADPSAERVQNAIKTIEEKTLAAGKTLASVAPDWAASQAMYERGYSVVLSMSDAVSLSKAAYAFNQSFDENFRK